MDKLKGAIKNVFLSKKGLFELALILIGIFAPDLVSAAIKDPMGVEIVTFALLMVSLGGTSMLMGDLSQYLRYYDEQNK